MSDEKDKDETAQEGGGFFGGLAKIGKKLGVVVDEDEGKRPGQKPKAPEPPPPQQPQFSSVNGLTSLSSFGAPKPATPLTQSPQYPNPAPYLGSFETTSGNPERFAPQIRDSLSEVLRGSVLAQLAKVKAKKKGMITDDDIQTILSLSDTTQEQLRHLRTNIEQTLANETAEFESTLRAETHTQVDEPRQALAAQEQQMQSLSANLAQVSQTEARGLMDIDAKLQQKLNALQAQMEQARQTAEQEKSQFKQQLATRASQTQRELTQLKQEIEPKRSTIAGAETTLRASQADFQAAIQVVKSEVLQQLDQAIRLL